MPHERQLRPTAPVALEPELGPGLGLELELELELELVPGPGHVQPELEPLVQLEHVQLEHVQPEPVPEPEPVPGPVLGLELELELELVPGLVRQLWHVAVAVVVVVVVVERQRLLLPLPVVEVADYSSAWDFGEPEGREIRELGKCESRYNVHKMANSTKTQTLSTE